MDSKDIAFALVIGVPVVCATLIIITALITDHLNRRIREKRKKAKAS